MPALRPMSLSALASGDAVPHPMGLEDGDRNDPATIAHLYVPRADGGLARLDSVARLEPASTASRTGRPWKPCAACSRHGRVC